MNGFFKQDSKLTRFLTAVVDLFVLQLLFILCSLPVFTIGASVTALFSVYRKLRQETTSVVIKPFFEEFKANFKQSTLVWLMFMFAAIVIAADLYVLYSLKTTASVVAVIITYFFIILIVITLVYVFPLIAWFQNDTFEQVKNALRMGISNIGVTIAVVAVYGVTVITGFIYFPIVALFGISGSAFFADKLLYRVFKKYITDNDENMLIEENTDGSAEDNK